MAALLMGCVVALGLLSGGTGIVGAEVDQTGGFADQYVIDDALNGTTTELDSSSDNPVDSVEETATETTDEVEGISGELTGSTEDLTSDTTAEVDMATAEATSAVDGMAGDSTEETSDHVNEIGNSTTGLLNETVTETTDVADGSINESMTLLDQTVTTTSDTLDETVSLPTQVVDTVSEVTLITDSQRSDVTSNATSQGDNSADFAPSRNESDDSSTPAGSAGSTTAFTVYLLRIVTNSTLVGGVSSSIVSSSSLSSTVQRLTLTNSSFRRADLPWVNFASLLRYSRHDDSDPLEHEHRKDVYTGIVENPGVCLSELETMSEISLSVLRHHLRVLETENMIKTEKIRGKRRIYPIEEDDIDLIAALSDSATRRVIVELKKRESARNDELAAALDCTPSTVSHHLTSLEERGLVVRERDGRVVVNRLPPKVIRTLDAEERTISADSDRSERACKGESSRSN